MTKSPESNSHQRPNHSNRSTIGKLLNPCTVFKLAPIHRDSLPGGKNAKTYKIDPRRVVDDKYAKVPVDAQLDHNSSIISYPQNSSKYVFVYRLICLIILVAIPLLVFLAGWFGMNFLAEGNRFEPVNKFLSPLVLVPLLSSYWIMFAAFSRALGERIPCDFVTERAFYHKGIARTGDTHAFSLLEKVGSTKESWPLKMGVVAFKAWGCREESTARIKDPKDFANVLANFRPSSIAAFPKLVESPSVSNDNGENAA